jgi:hypothetical protein
MVFFLPKEVREGLERARQRDLVKKSRIRVAADGELFPVIRLSEDGFSLPAGAPKLRGLVDLYEGSKHLAQCLIVASSEEHGEMHYEYKRRTEAAEKPALDFERDEGAPVALLGPAG